MQAIHRLYDSVLDSYKQILLHPNFYDEMMKLLYSKITMISECTLYNCCQP